VPTTDADVSVPPQQSGDVVTPQQGAVGSSTGQGKGQRILDWFKDLSGLQQAVTLIGGIVALIGGIIAAIVGIITIYEKVTYEKPTPRLAFVDVAFLNRSAMQDYPLDIKVRNTGKGAAYIKRADLKVERIWKLTPPYLSPGEQCAFLAPTREYRMKLPTSGAPFVRKERLSQEIRTGDGDRFVIGFAYSDPRQVYFNDYVFLAKLSLVYGEDNKRVSKDVLFASSQVGCDLFYEQGNNHVPGRGLDASDVTRFVSQNERNLEEIGHSKAVKSSYVQHLIRTGERPDIPSASAMPKPQEQDEDRSQKPADVYPLGEKVKVGDVVYTNSATLVCTCTIARVVSISLRTCSAAFATERTYFSASGLNPAVSKRRKSITSFRLRLQGLSLK
jgi:hypothetical protein